MGKNRLCHVASEETITGTTLVAEASRSLEFAISRMLFKKPAVLCILIATVANQEAGDEVYSFCWCPAFHLGGTISVHVCIGNQLPRGFVVMAGEGSYMPSIVASLFMILTLRSAKT
jgi:hypothetical protein